METFLEILKYILPALIVLLTTFITLRIFFENEQKKLAMNAKTIAEKDVLSVKMQAYEFYPIIF